MFQGTLRCQLHCTTKSEMRIVYRHFETIEITYVGHVYLRQTAGRREDMNESQWDGIDGVILCMQKSIKSLIQ